ncbi:Methyltransferase [Colletotrichum higginsianum IMI 349063]|uniref:Methyltransferase n=3 Tax=Colletotrichum higginsianum TaxID=80884 RepID=A0A1B7Y9Y1_COLHI|nr:Methyltransferase [Colletotrichum higginsianum IMI 349063]OBR08862.1 Methyltransferase [Colletotrichum higginsianum IMI 349063]
MSAVDGQRGGGAWSASFGAASRERSTSAATGTGPETPSASGHEPCAPTATRGIDCIPRQAAGLEKQSATPVEQSALPQNEQEAFGFSYSAPDISNTSLASAKERQGPKLAVGTETEKNMPVTAAKLGEGDEQPRGTEHAFGIEMSSTNSYDAARDSFKALRSPLTHPNGVPIFPDLSTEQQVSEASEATSQAESSIVADSDELDSTFDETDPSDAGYASDSATNASTSIESSVRDYMYENGRRYHRFREGQYNFPNDEMEQEREDMKHAMVKLLCNQKLNFAPIGEWPQQVLDIGTGTGAWAIEMGDEYPSATVLGVDLSPIQPEWVPPNVKFEVDDVESPWLYPANHFDYIHSRHTVMAIKDWGALFQRSFEHLRPGGWIELQEIHHAPLSANNSVSVTAHPVARYWGHVAQGLSNLGIDLNAAAGDRLPNMMREAGFVNVTERVFHVPIGVWPRNRVLKTVGMYWRTILLDGLQAIALGPFTRGLHWSAEQTEVFLVEVRRAYHDTSALMYMPLKIMYAQKPRSV